MEIDSLLENLQGKTDNQELVLETIAKVATTCFDTGADLAMRNPGTPTENLNNAIRLGNDLWDYVSDYAKTAHGMELHPLGMLIVLYQVMSYDEDGATEEIKAGIKNFLDIKAKEAEEALKPDEVVDVPEIESSDDSIEVLIRKYFALMEEIGTFYRDRTRYDSDDKRELHDQIVALYSKIVSKM